MSQLVIRHPDIADPGMCSQEQYDVLYARKGWEVTSIDPAFAAEVLGETITDIDELDLDQLRHVVAAYDKQKPSEKKAGLLERSAEDLREQAKSLGLSAGGSKDDLASRILEAEQATADAAAGVAAD